MRRKIGVLFQDGALFGSMNLYDNVAFPLRQHTEKGEEEIAEIVNAPLREVGLSDAMTKMPNELSGGMRKRAGFARALVLEPDIVLFDEPDSGLDPVRTALLCELIQEMHADRRQLPRRHPRHRLRAPDRRAHRAAVEGADRRIGLLENRRRSCSPRRTRSCASSSRAATRATRVPADDGSADRRWFSGAFQRATEHVGVEAPRALDVVRDDEVGQHDPLCRRSELGHLPPPLVGTHTPLTRGVYRR
jgi:hypothetical protein